MKDAATSTCARHWLTLCMSPVRDATCAAISTIGLPDRSRRRRGRMWELHEHRRHVTDRPLSMPGHRSRHTHFLWPERRNRHRDRRSVTRVRVVGNQHGRLDRDHVVARGPGRCDALVSGASERRTRRTSRNPVYCRAAPRPDAAGTALHVRRRRIGQHSRARWRSAASRRFHACGLHVERECECDVGHLDAASRYRTGFDPGSGFGEPGLGGAQRDDRRRRSGSAGDAGQPDDASTAGTPTCADAGTAGTDAAGTDASAWMHVHGVAD